MYSCRRISYANSSANAVPPLALFALSQLKHLNVPMKAGFKPLFMSRSATSLAGNSTANVLSQNGFASGTLANITIAQDGTVQGAFTNGQVRTLAQVALATFQNEGGLTRTGGNAFSETNASGLAQIGTAGVGRFGGIVSGSLEQSNVSLADQFTKLIVAQRAFEANTRGITTADQNLQTVINLRASEN